MIAPGRRERVPDQDRRILPEAAAQKEIQTRAVRVGDPRRALASGGHLVVRQLPIEDDLVVPGRNRRPGHGARRNRRAGEGRKARDARDDEPSPRRRPRDGGITRGSNSARTAAGSAVGLPDRSIDTSAVRAVTSRSSRRRTSVIR